jgi:multidrug resistance efflux pump
VVYDQETIIFKGDATTERRYKDAVQKHKAAQAARERAGAQIRKVEQWLAARIGEDHALVAEAQADLDLARLNLEWTRVCAPANGYVTNFQLREGSYVHAGTPVLTFIDSDQWWVVANYRENALENIRPGQRVGLTFNTYPGRIFPGVVRIVTWGVNQGQGAPTGNLPEVVEPHNWIRLAQRFQVWITPELPEGYPLRVGTTASVVVYTQDEFWLNPVTEIWQEIVAHWNYLY